MKAMTLTTGNIIITTIYDYDCDCYTINAMTEQGEILEDFPVGNPNLVSDFAWAIAKKYRKAGDGITCIA